METTTSTDGKIACRVKTFAQRHSFGPYPPGAIVYVEPAEMDIPAVRAALITVEEDEKAQAAKLAKVKAESDARVAAFERERAAVIAAQRAAKDAEQARLAANQPGPVTAPSSRPRKE